LNCGLFASLGGGKNSARKAGENGLFGHTFKPYPNRLFVLFCEGKSPEIPLKVVPFGTGSKYRFTSPYSSPEARDLTR
jgi:hypothetical protein